MVVCVFVYVCVCCVLLVVCVCTWVIGCVIGGQGMLTRRAQVGGCCVSVVMSVCFVCVCVCACAGVWRWGRGA